MPLLDVALPPTLIALGGATSLLLLDPELSDPRVLVALAGIGITGAWAILREVFRYLRENKKQDQFDRKFARPDKTVGDLSPEALDVRIAATVTKVIEQYNAATLIPLIDKMFDLQQRLVKLNEDHERESQTRDNTLRELTTALMQLRNQLGG